MKNYSKSCFLFLNLLFLFFSSHAQLDNTFNAGGAGANSYINCVAMQTDGKILIGGNFVQYNGIAVNRILRLNANGSIDNTFSVGSGASDEVFCITVQPDGKILIGGMFTQFNGAPANRIIRLNTNGTKDNSFNTGSGASDAVRAIALLSNNKIIVGGNFAQFNGVTKGKILRLGVNGGVDNTLNAGGSGFNANGTIQAILVLSGDKIIVGGSFVQYNTTSAGRLIRLKANGLPDPAFNPGGAGADNVIRALAVQPNGKILIGGSFSQYNTSAKGKIARLQSNGTIDVSFNSTGSGANDIVRAIALQTDGKIVIGGNFVQYNTSAANRIARLKSTGAIDNSFNTGSGASGAVFALTVQADGALLVAGAFAQFATQAKGRIVRLLSDIVLPQPVIEWQNNIGGSLEDRLFSVAQTADGGYVMGGYSKSGISGDKTEICTGFDDFWVVKVNSAGVLVWENTIGGTSYDEIISLAATPDGGCVLGGRSASNISGDKTENSNGGSDYWVLKINNTGGIEWQNTIGGSLTDDLHSISPTSDGGYILGGFSESNISGDKTENSRGNFDYWVVKLNAAGNIDWQKTLGGSDYDNLWSVKQTTDGGYIVGGYSSSNISGDKTENATGYDYWVVKLNSTGGIEWQNTIGGSSIDYLCSLAQTTDGGYIVGGYSYSDISGDKTQNSFGDGDYWVVKLNSSGTIQWQNTVGGNAQERMTYVAQTPDGGYILGGDSESGISGNKTENTNGFFDYWLVKLNATGTIQWQNSIGGNGGDTYPYMALTSDGGYILGGSSDSNISGDKTENSNGNLDFWIVKLSGTGQRIAYRTIEIPGTIISDVKCYPNPSADRNVYIVFNAAAPGQSILQLIDMMGKTILVKKLEIVTGLNRELITLSDFPSGMYTLKLKTKGEIVIRKIIKN